MARTADADHYPDMHLRITASDGSLSELAVAATTVRLGRNPDCHVVFPAEKYPQVSGAHAQIERRASGGYVLIPLSRSNPTLVNGQPIEGPVAVREGDQIRLGLTGPTVQLVPGGGSASGAGRSDPAPVAFSPTERATPQHLALLRGSQAAQRMPIGQGGIIGRDREASGIFALEHPQVSRQHASLSVQGDGVVLRDLGSANGTYVNGHRVAAPVLLKAGDKIDIGPFSLAFDGQALVSRSRSNNIELVARGLRRVVKDRASGKPLSLLEGVSLVVRPREFVCLLGPSGSGKSTLLAMLSGRNPPDRGAVWINGQELYESFAALKQDIAVVPQKDVLHEALAVGTALRYTAELRLPSDTSRTELDNSVADILSVVGLTERRQTLIRHLSGGQIKRASLANELMGRPSLLFLDEVTSGLDEQTDRDMMELFRQVADSGKTVVCITHSLANVEATCNLVVILTEGGRLAFIGTPDETRKYFGVQRLGDVYRKLPERPAADWQAAFKTHPLYSRYVRERLPARDDFDEEQVETAVRQEQTPVNPVRQAWILTRRYLSIWRGDPFAILTMLGQALLVALLLGSVFGNLGRTGQGADPAAVLDRAQRTLNLLFLLNVACFWFGCNNAAKELVKERISFARERDFNLRLDSYYASKFIVLVLIGLLQVTLLFGIARSWCQPPGSLFGQWFVLAALTVAGTALGLLISAFALTEEVAVALVPIAVMPQIILGGVIAPLSGPALWLAHCVTTVHSGERALEALLPAADLTLLSRSNSGMFWPLLLMLFQGVAFAALTFVILWRRDSAGRKR
jgi:ABC transport system ATP-binding/permease protein